MKRFDINHKSFTERAPKLGGSRVLQKEYYGHQISSSRLPETYKCNKFKISPQEAMDYAEEMNLVMSRMEAADKQYIWWMWSKII